MTPPAEPFDWERLASLRELFLETAPTREAAPDYWSDEATLAAYDSAFAERIGWKWRAVVAELEQRGWSPPEGEVLDWACGTGIAARRWLDAFAPRATAVHPWDRSRRACSFAARRLMEEHPATTVRSAPRPFDGPPAVVLISHALNELGAADLVELTAHLARATVVVWVENGSRPTSRALGRVREALLDSFRVVAPCPHQDACGIFAEGNESHWCHHFARPPAEVFTEGRWARFGRELGIDLRSLPYSFLVLDRRPAEPAAEPAPTLGPTLGRVLGRPRLLKGRASLMACDRAGVRQLDLLKRTAPQVLRTWKDSAGQLLLYRWEVDGSRIRSIEPAAHQPPPPPQG